MPSRRPSPETCANCGAAIPRDARACPECGADERSGWRETSIYDGLDLPDTGFADVAEPSAPRRRYSLAWYGLAALVLLAALLIAILARP